MEERASRRALRANEPATRKMLGQMRIRRPQAQLICSVVAEQVQRDLGFRRNGFPLGPRVYILRSAVDGSTELGKSAS